MTEGRLAALLDADLWNEEDRREVELELLRLRLKEGLHRTRLALLADILKAAPRTAWRASSTSGHSLVYADTEAQAKVLGALAQGCEEEEVAPERWPEMDRR